MEKQGNFQVALLLMLSVIALIIVGVILSNGEPIAFSHVSGFYDTPIKLEISTDIWGAKIYYTTDGSVPDSGDILYVAPLNLKKIISAPNNLSARMDVVDNDGPSPVGKASAPLDEDVMKGYVIRAVAIAPWGASSPVISSTFFIGYDRESEFEHAPIISIMVEETDLFDYDRGIYVNGRIFDEWKSNADSLEDIWNLSANYMNRGKEWERKALIEYIPFDSVSGFSQVVGLRIKGGMSRRAPQKSLRLTARAEYGAKAINYPLIPSNKRFDGNGELEEYKAVSLRNGGNDIYVKIRDPLIQRLATGMNFITQSSTPCVVFINGEYWGAYAITEEYSDNYIGHNFYIDNDNVISYKVDRIENGKDEDITLFNDMFEYIISNDMSRDENYFIASQMLDMESYQDYCALQLYIGNTDGIFQWNNYQMWRVREPNIDQDKIYSDGKWRMMLYDTELSVGFGDDDFCMKDYLTPVISEDIVDEYTGEFGNPRDMFKALWQNELFKQEFVLSLCDVRNIYFEKERALGVFSEIVQEYEPLLIKSIKRFPSEFVNENLDIYIEHELEEISRNLVQRYIHFPEVLQKSLGLSESCTIHISAMNAEKGKILLNQNELDSEKTFTGDYFPEYAVTLSAVSNEGHTFVGWEKNGEMISAATDIEVQVEDGMMIKAVFQ